MQSKAELPRLGASRLHLQPGCRVLRCGPVPECDVRVQEATVSRRHCSIVRRAGRYRVEELGSTYGTLVNGRKLPAEGVVLRRGDVIAFASTGPASTTLLLGPPRESRSTR